MNDGSAATTLNDVHDKSRTSSNVTNEKITATEMKQEIMSEYSKDHSDRKVSELDQSIEPENEIKGLKLILVHSAMCLCTFLIGLDFNLIATAVPVITSRFNSIDDVGWYGAAFYIALCTTQPLAGKTYTLFPKKSAYLIYLALFEIGSLICALAPTSSVLIAGRAVAGAGASGVFAGGFAVLAVIVPLHKRAIFIGTMSSTFAVASIVGPPIGGALTQHVSWRWCFYINLPIGGFAALIVCLFFRIKKAPTENVSLMEKLKSMDGIGFTLFAGSISMLLLALQFGGVTFSWSSSVIIGLLVGCGVVMALFVGWQIYFGDHALIPPKLFTNRNVGLIMASSFFVNGPFQTIVYWLPIWFQAILGASPTGSGVRYLPTVIADVLSSTIGAGIVMKLGIWNPFLMFAEAMVSLGAGLLSSLHPGSSAGHWIGYQIFGGIGYSLATNLAQLGMQASLSQDLVPIGSTILLTVVSASCSIFLAIGQAIFQDRLAVNLSAVVSPEVARTVESVGATSIRSAIGVGDLDEVLRAYSSSLSQVFYVPAAAPVIALAFVVFTKWTSIKKLEVAKIEKKADV